MIVESKMQYRESKTASNKDANEIYVLAGKPAIKWKIVGGALCVRVCACVNRIVWGAVHLTKEFDGPLSFFFASLIASSLSSILTWKIYAKATRRHQCLWSEHDSISSCNWRKKGAFSVFLPPPLPQNLPVGCGLISSAISRVWSDR